MKTYQIDILNPKATKLLKELADLKLITIRETKKEDFLDVVSNLRKKAASKTPTMEEIPKEVELARTNRYAKTKS